MGVLTVTISIEEFEELINCKGKLERIKELKTKNIEQVKETNRLFEIKHNEGDREACERLLREQSVNNIIYIAKIALIL